MSDSTGLPSAIRVAGSSRHVMVFGFMSGGHRSHHLSRVVSQVMSASRSSTESA